MRSSCCSLQTLMLLYSSCAASANLVVTMANSAVTESVKCVDQRRSLATDSFAPNSEQEYVMQQWVVMLDWGADHSGVSTCCQLAAVHGPWTAAAVHMQVR